MSSNVPCPIKKIEGAGIIFPALSTGDSDDSITALPVLLGYSICVMELVSAKLFFTLTCHRHTSISHDLSGKLKYKVVVFCYHETAQNNNLSEHEC
jgi:hypothetical protein